MKMCIITTATIIVNVIDIQTMIGDVCLLYHHHHHHHVERFEHMPKWMEGEKRVRIHSIERNKGNNRWMMDRDRAGRGGGGLGTRWGWGYGRPLDDDDIVIKVPIVFVCNTYIYM